MEVQTFCLAASSAPPNPTPSPQKLCWQLGDRVGDATVPPPAVTRIFSSRIPASAGSPGGREEVFRRLFLCPHQPAPPGVVRPLRPLRQVPGDPARHGHHAQRAAGVVLLPRRPPDHAGPGQGDGAQLQQVTGGRRKAESLFCPFSVPFLRGEHPQGVLGVRGLAS